MGVLKTALCKSTRRVTGGLATAGRGDPLQLGSSRALQIALVVASLVLGSGPSRAANWNVDNGGNWSTAGNWSGSVPDAADALANLTYNITASRTVTLNLTSKTVGTLKIGDGDYTPSGSVWNSYTLAASAGLSLILDNGALSAQIEKIAKKYSTGTAAGDTISAPILLNSSLDIFNSCADATLSFTTGGITANSEGTKTISNKGTAAGGVVISGVVGDGSGKIAVVQNTTTSKLTLSGANTYSGDTTISAGALVVGNALALQNSTLSNVNGTVSFASGITAFTLGGLAGTKDLGLTNAGSMAIALTVGQNDTNTTYGGVLSGGGSLIKVGEGKLTLSTNNTYTGATVVSNGVLDLRKDAAMGTGNALVTAGGVLQASSLKTGGGFSSSISNRGGVYQFTSATPTITPGTANSILLTNGTLAYVEVSDVNLYNSQVSNLTFQGNNTFRLDHSSTMNAGQNYTFATGLGAANYTRLEMVNGDTLFQGGALTVGVGGSVLASNTIATFAGILTNSGEIRVVNASAIYQGNVMLNTGGSYLSQNSSNTFNSGLTIASGVSFTVGADSWLSVLGSYINQGSSVFSNRYTVASGTHYQSSGGSTNQFAGGLTISSGGGFDVTNGTSTVSGAITNAGTINVVNSRVTYGGPVVISGGYISDPSTNIFATNVTVTAGGYLQGGTNDLFIFYQDLTMQSTNRALFSLSSASMLFTNGNGAGATNHLFDLRGSASIDKGSNWLDHTQLATNFSIGTLSIAAGNQLVLDGDRGTNALYVGWLDLSTWGITNASSLTNALLGALILEGINLYYDKYDPRNGYLDGQIYEFDQWDVSQSLLIPIPESSTWVMIGGAALMFLVLKRKDKGA